MLLQKAHAALPPGGALIVYERLIDDARRTSSTGLLSSLNMLLETAGGSEYTANECRQWMEDAGFTEISVRPLGDMHSALIGIKP